VCVIVTAPTAAWFEFLLELDADPALVIGLPVGFVARPRRKAALRASGLPACQPEREGRCRVGRRRAQRPAVPRGGPVPVGAPGRERTVLLIVGHGTRTASGVAQFLQLIDLVRDRSAGWLPGLDGGFIDWPRRGG